LAGLQELLQHEGLLLGRAQGLQFGRLHDDVLPGSESAMLAMSGLFHLLYTHVDFYRTGRVHRLCRVVAHIQDHLL